MYSILKSSCIKRPRASGFIILTIIALALFAVLLPHNSQAMLLGPDGGGSGYSQQERAPTYEFEPGLNIQQLPNLTNAGPAQIIIWFFYLGLGFIGILALIMIVVGGIQYITGSIEPAQQNDAKQRITAAITALILALGSFVILYTINPNLTRLKNPSLPCVSCECWEARGQPGVELAPGLNGDNCIKSGVIQNSSGFSTTNISGSGDTCLINAAKTIPGGDVRALARAAGACDYIGIESDDSTATNCAVYCMRQKNDSCDYHTKGPEACNWEWGKAQNWICAQMPPGSVCDSWWAVENSGDDMGVAACPYLTSYVSNAIDLGGKFDLCKCAATVKCVTPEGSYVETGS